MHNPATPAKVPVQQSVDSIAGIFVRFLWLGLRAFGGPGPQLAMIKAELVEGERWIAVERFNRILGVYQALPGPEAHEMCCYLGLVRGGRRGALAAGAGFMLPGLILMLGLGLAYQAVGLNPVVAAALAMCQPVVVALVIRAVHRLGLHAVNSLALFVVAIGAMVLTLLGVHFAWVLAWGALGHWLVKLDRRAYQIGGWVGLLGAAVLLGTLARNPAAPALDTARFGAATAATLPHIPPVPPIPPIPPTAVELASTGLRAGFLSFGGAYTALPILQHDAVDVGGYMTQQQFLDGVALVNTIPAPLVTVAAFVGLHGGRASGGGIWPSLGGGLLMAAMIFLPSFAFTLLGHRLLERLVDNKSIHAALDGITAAAIGLLAAVALLLAGPVLLTSPASLTVFAGSLFALFHSKSVWIAPTLIGLAAVVGVILR